MNQMLELGDKDFQLSFITILQKKKVNIYELKKKLSWKDEKKNEWNFRMKNITHAIKNFLNWLIF